MRTLPADITKAIPQQRQSQAALNDQLFDLAHVANRLGLYDAADYLRQQSVPRDAKHSELCEHKRSPIWLCGCPRVTQ